MRTMKWFGQRRTIQLSFSDPICRAAILAADRRRRPRWPPYNARGCRQPPAAKIAALQCPGRRPTRQAKSQPSRDSVANVKIKPGPLRKFLSILGPGVITGAADDDPSGIATYSIAGAQHGTALLWTALITWPLMGAVQMMCARISMVTGRGLAGTLRKRFPKWL